MKVAKQIEMTITYAPGQNGVTVAGPVDNKALCYGMLELARDAIVEFHQKKANGVGIVAASAGDIPPATRLPN